MADKVTARNTDKQFQPHPEGQFVGQCMDVIDMGEELTSFPGKPEKLVPKVAFVYRTGELNDEGVCIDLVAEFTVSLGDLANLRAYLEQWRGKALSEDQVREGVPLDKMEGTWALLTVAHKVSKKGRTYAYIVSAVGVPKQMQRNLPHFTGYVRPKYLVDKKETNKVAAAAFMERLGVPTTSKRLTGPGDETPFGNPPEEDFAETDDNSLPF